MAWETNELERVYDSLRDRYIASVEEQHKLKIRVKALERAIKGDCQYCGNKDCVKYPCYCINGNAWQFDEARFSKGGADER